MDGTALYDGANATANFSGSIWADCPLESFRDKQQSGPTGVLWEKSFATFPILPAAASEGLWGDLAVYGDTGRTLASETIEAGGGAQIGTDGDNESVVIRSAGCPFKIILTGGDLWFEARIATSTITDTKHNIFLGLMEDVAGSSIIPITAGGVLADKNMVGFFRPETARSGAGTGGAIMNATYKADGVSAVNVQTDAVSLVAATYTNLGMKFVANRSIKKGAGYLYFYQDGAIVGSKLIPSAAGTDFPNDINLGFVFAVLNGTAATPGTSSIKHVRIAQLQR